MATAFCLVVSCEDHKRGVMIALVNNTGATVDVGVVTIPPDHKIPKIGTVVGVRYAYACRGGNLYQAVYLGRREDVTEDACILKQLKYQTGTGDEPDVRGCFRPWSPA